MSDLRLSTETLEALFFMITMERLHSSLQSLSLTPDSGYCSPELSGENQALIPDINGNFNGERGLVVWDEMKDQSPNILTKMSTCTLKFQEGRRLKAKTTVNRRQPLMDKMATSEHKDVELLKKRHELGTLRCTLNRGTRKAVVFQRRVNKMHWRKINILKPRPREADMPQLNHRLEPSVHTNCNLPPAIFSSQRDRGTQLYSRVFNQEKAWSHGLQDSAGESSLSRCRELKGSAAWCAQSFDQFKSTTMNMEIELQEEAPTSMVF